MILLDSCIFGPGARKNISQGPCALVFLSFKVKISVLLEELPKLTAYGLEKINYNLSSTVRHLCLPNENSKDSNAIGVTSCHLDKTNIASFNAVKRQGLTKSNCLTWTGLRQSIPQNLRTSTLSNFKVVLNLETFQCRYYYSYLIKHVYERPRKWARLSEDFDLGDDQIADVYLLPIKWHMNLIYAPFNIRF